MESNCLACISPFNSHLGNVMGLECQAMESVFLPVKEQNADPGSLLT